MTHPLSQACISPLQTARTEQIQALATKHTQRCKVNETEKQQMRKVLIRSSCGRKSFTAVMQLYGRQMTDSRLVNHSSRWGRNSDLNQRTGPMNIQAKVHSGRNRNIVKPYRYILWPRGKIREFILESLGFSLKQWTSVPIVPDEKVRDHLN